jgi:hypothetical protein
MIYIVAIFSSSLKVQSAQIAAFNTLLRDLDLNAETQNGYAITPLELSAADTTSALEERSVGGLGIHLVRRIMARFRVKNVA